MPNELLILITVPIDLSISQTSSEKLPLAVDGNSNRPLALQMVSAQRLGDHGGLNPKWDIHITPLLARLRDQGKLGRKIIKTSRGSQ